METNIEDLNSKIDQFLVGGRKGFEFIHVHVLAEKIGSSEVVLRFLLGILVGFPFAFIYLLLSNSNRDKKHLYFTITGLLINYFCFGPDFFYNLFSVFISYASLVLFGGTIQNVIFTFFFQSTYLTAGYILNASDGYDVKWTTPQCILCLKLIGLAWDVYDGKQNEEKLSADQLKTCVKHNPTLMEVFGYSYCFCGFLGGPQFSFQRYLKFINGTLVDKKAGTITPSRFIESLKRFMAAVCMCVLFSYFGHGYRSDDLLKPSFLQKPFVTKVINMALVYYIQFTKYVIVWWYTESIYMLVGLSYGGLDDNGNATWNGLRNFKLRQFVSGAFFQDIVESFNIHTNQWSGRYLFRRLRFLGNKTLSHVITLIYLAIWHGFYIGYFIMFALEYILVIAERQYCAAFKKLFGLSFADLPLPIKIPVQILGALFKFFTCGFCVQSFMLLRWRKIKIVYGSVYYWPLIVMTVWFFVLAPVMMIITKSKRKQKDEKKKE